MSKKTTLNNENRLNSYNHLYVAYKDLSINTIKSMFENNTHSKEITQLKHDRRHVRPAANPWLDCRLPSSSLLHES